MLAYLHSILFGEEINIYLFILTLILTEKIVIYGGDSHSSSKS